VRESRHSTERFLNGEAARNYGLQPTRKSRGRLNRSR